MLLSFMGPQLVEAQDPEEEPTAEAFASLQDGFGVRSKDGRSVLRLGSLFAVRGFVEVPDEGDVVPRAEVRLARIAVFGHLAGGMCRYFGQLEMAKGVSLLDLELTGDFRPELQIRVGRFRTPYSREFIMPLTDMQLVARSVVSDYFRADRDTGVSVEGACMGPAIRVPRRRVQRRPRPISPRGGTAGL